VNLADLLTASAAKYGSRPAVTDVRSGRSLSYAELASEAELIFCMTKAHRQAVIEMLPQFAGKTYCLHAETDVDDPIGKGMTAYVECAKQIQSLVRLRLSELGLAGA